MVRSWPPGMAGAPCSSSASPSWLKKRRSMRSSTPGGRLMLRLTALLVETVTTLGATCLTTGAKLMVPPASTAAATPGAGGGWWSCAKAGAPSSGARIARERTRRVARGRREEVLVVMGVPGGIGRGFMPTDEAAARDFQRRSHVDPTLPNVTGRTRANVVPAERHFTAAGPPPERARACGACVTGRGGERAKPFDKALAQQPGADSAYRWDHATMLLRRLPIAILALFVAIAAMLPSGRVVHCRMGAPAAICPRAPARRPRWACATWAAPRLRTGQAVLRRGAVAAAPGRAGG